ncbi:unnamed protein product [Arctogadus glacialis]
MRWAVLAQVALCCLGTVRCFCPAQCTCTPNSRDGGSVSSSVVCNDPDMADIPINVPVDTVKLRVEKTGVRRVPSEAFYYLPDLRYLWITYNAVSALDPGAFYNLKLLHELRLDGNQISVFPWDALREMPSLRTLDLHNNRLAALPAEAVALLPGLTYLDLSSNRLGTLPSDLMDLWPPFNGSPVRKGAGQKVILGLQDNPWICDCRLSKIIALSKMTDCPVVLMDLFVTCSGPENLAGVLLQRVELEECVKPTVMTSATQLTSPLGSNLLLRCDATGLPTPSLLWAKSDGTYPNNTVQESPVDGVRWSIMSLLGILGRDAGNYSCSAKNYAGNAQATISVAVAGGDVTTPLPPPLGTSAEPGTSGGPAVSTALPSTPLVTSASASTTINTTLVPTTAAAVTTPAPGSSPPTTAPPRLTTPLPPPPPAETKSPTPRPPKPPPGIDSRKLAADETSKKTDASRALRGLKVVEEGPDSAVLLWTAQGLARDAALTVVCSPYGDQDAKRTLETTAGSGKVLLEGLAPGLRYSVCLVGRGPTQGKDPCLDFYTLGEGGGPSLLLVASWVACAVALPLIGLLLYKIVALSCSGPPPDAEQLEKESYVGFETISMKQRGPGARASELWARRAPNDSERMMLCSRSSLDSQTTYKSESSRSEYLC